MKIKNWKMMDNVVDQYVYTTANNDTYEASQCKETIKPVKSILVT